MRVNRWVLRSTLLASACYLTTSCATLDQAGARHGTAIGCGVGAVVGGLLGNVIGQKTGNRQLATVAGAAAGTAVPLPSSASSDAKRSRVATSTAQVVL